MWLIILAGLPLLVFILFKLFGLYITSNDDYWPKRNVPFVPTSEVPSAWKSLLGQKPLHEIDSCYYKRYPESRFIGFMEARKPAVMIRDPELIKKVTVKDFDHFSDRRTFNFGGKYNDGFLFNMNGNKWKSMRAMMTPTFTSGKMRRMFQHFEKSANDMADFVQRKRSKDGETIDADTREIFGRFSMDVIGSTAFGIDSQCLKDDSSPFYEIGQELQKATFFRGIKIVIIIMLPKIASLLNIAFLPHKPMEFFGSIVSRAFSTRLANFEQKSKIKGGKHQYPSDFLQLMVEAQHRSQDDDNDDDKNDGEDDLAKFEEDAKLQVKQENGKTDNNSWEITEEIVVANSVTFFLAGFDNTEAIITVAAYHLAVSPEYQDRLRNEVEQVIADFQGKITYDGVARMTYLDMFISECLRLYPPATRLERKVTKPYKIPESDVTLEVGTLVAMPVLAFHKDPKYYPNPDEFNPERFSAEAKANRHPYVYFPFGLGPKSCIAMRFVLTEIKAAVAHLVHKFEIRTCKETTIPLKMMELQGMHRPASGLKLALVDRHQ